MMGERIILNLPHVLEIAAVLKELKCDPALTLDLVSLWGPSLRIIKDIVKERSLLLTYLQAAAQDLWTSSGSYINMSAEQTQDGSLILFLRPRREYVTSPWSPYPILDTSSYNFFIPTKFLTDRLMDPVARRIHQVSNNLLAILSSHYVTKFPMAWNYECKMHHRMCSGGAPLVLYNDNSQMNMMPSTVLIPGSLRSIEKSTSFYWMPTVGNFAGIDGALSDGSNIFILQASITAEHSNPLDGIKKFWQNVSSDVRNTWEWHFVVIGNAQQTANSLLEKFTVQLADLTLGKESVRVTVWACVLKQWLD